MVQLRFATTLFLSATLLFAIQPTVARMIVPLLGGAPAVWVVCSLCFQTLLLAGYLWAHFTGTKLRVRTQIVLQLCLVASVFLVMPIGIDEGSAHALLAKYPTLGVAMLLAKTVGLPFFVLSTTSPLLQRWYAELGETDPYHLYAASNAGSMLALLGYPFIIEPLLPIKAQSSGLHGAFAVYAILMVVSAFATAKVKAPLRADATPAPPGVRVSVFATPGSLMPDPPKTRREIWQERFTWLVLAFAPSSLLLGATEYVTSDLASVPLLWVVPLALYLASFIVAFAKKQPVTQVFSSRVLALAAAAVAVTILAEGVWAPAWLLAATHMLLLFVASVVCHRALAVRRPPVTRLTEFYLLLSVGGVLGGLFNGIVAPLVFDDLVEYPVAVGLVCIGRAFARPPSEADKATLRRQYGRDLSYGLALGLGTWLLVRVGSAWRADPKTSFGWMFGVPLLVAAAWARRPVRYALAIGGILVAGVTHGGRAGDVIYAERSFFGVLKVARDPAGRYRALIYGRAMHGRQSIAETEKRTPLAYYHPTGPAGDVLGPASAPRRVGVIGLGIGSLAGYAESGDTWTFFEINPRVVELARKHFTYLDDVPHDAKVDVQIGDGRLRLREAPPASLDIIVLDAFTSDAVPTHLLTREALAIYRRALASNGILLVHVTNGHVKLQPVFAALARDAGMSAFARTDFDVTMEERAAGKVPSEWVLLTAPAQSTEELPIENKARWTPAVAPPSQSVWTDDFANVLGALRF